MTQLPIQSFQSSLDVAVNALSGAGQQVAAERQMKSEEKKQRTALVAQAQMQKSKIDADMHAQMLAGQQQLESIAAEGANYAKLNESRERIASDDRASNEKIAGERNALDRERLELDEKHANKMESIRLQREQAEVRANRAGSTAYDAAQASLNDLERKLEAAEEAHAAMTATDVLASQSSAERDVILKKIMEGQTRVEMLRGQLSEASALGVQTEVLNAIEQTTLGSLGNMNEYFEKIFYDSGGRERLIEGGGSLNIPAEMVRLPIAVVEDAIISAFYGDNAPAAGGDSVGVPDVLLDAGVLGATIVTGSLDGLRTMIGVGEGSSVTSAKAKVADAFALAVKLSNSGMVPDDQIEGVQRKIASLLDDASGEVGAEYVRAALGQLENADLLGQGIKAGMGDKATKEIIDRTTKTVAAATGLLFGAANNYGDLSSELDDKKKSPEDLFSKGLLAVLANTPSDEQQETLTRLFGSPEMARDFIAFEEELHSYNENVKSKGWSKQKAQKARTELAAKRERLKWQIERDTDKMHDAMQRARLASLDDSFQVMIQDMRTPAVP